MGLRVSDYDDVFDQATADVTAKFAEMAATEADAAAAVPETLEDPEPGAEWPSHPDAGSDREDEEAPEGADAEDEPDEPAPEDDEPDEPTEFIDVSEDTTVRLPDGRTVKVKDGLSMQADYTRKTQELAEQRRVLEQEETRVTEALEQAASFYEQKAQDPAGWATELLSTTPDPTASLAKAIIALNEQGKLSDEFRETFHLEPVKQAATQDATAQRIQELEQRLAEREANEQRRTQIEQAVQTYEGAWSRIKASEGLSFGTPEEEARAKGELVKFARERELTDLETAYAALAYQRRKAEPRPEDRQAVDRKRRAAAMTARGHKAAPKPRDPADLESLIHEQMAAQDDRWGLTT